MKKVIYDNQSSKLLAVVSGGVIELKQYLDGDEVGVIYLTNDEAEELSKFFKELRSKNIDSQSDDVMSQ